MSVRVKISFFEVDLTLKERLNLAQRLGDVTSEVKKLQIMPTE